MSVTNIAYGSNFSPTTVYVPGIYLQVIPPQAFFGGAPTSVAATEGTAAWGPLNTPILLSDPIQLARTYGNITVAAVDDLHDLPTSVTQALQQGSNQAAVAIYASRIGHNSGDSETITIGGSGTEDDVVNILFTNAALPSGAVNIQYVVGSGDNTTDIADGLVALILADDDLTGVGFDAANTGAVITVTWPPIIGATVFTSAVNGTETATLSGSPTTDEIIYVTVHNAALMGGELIVDYTVLVSDTTNTDVATGLAAAINAESALSDIGITADSTGAVVTIYNEAVLSTTYTRTNSANTTITLAGGPSETVALVAVTGGPQAAALTLVDKSGSPQNGIDLTAFWTGSLGDQIQTIVADNLANGTKTFTVVPFAGGGNIEVFTGLPAGGAFFPALQSALNNGQGSQRPHSQFVRGSNAVTTSLGPVNGKLALSGGTDGRSVTSGELVGSESSPISGIYTIETVQFTPSVMWVPGLTDSETFPTIQAFWDANNIFGLFTFATGQSVPAVVAVKAGIGIQDYQVGYGKDWTYWFDSANNQTRLTDPLSIMGGYIATLPPWVSPCNKAVKGVVGTERNNPFTGNQPYSYAELNELGQAGIMTLTNPINRGPQFGFANGYNSVGSNLPTAFVEYSRLTNFFVQTNGMILGQYVGDLQGYTASDPLRAQIRTAINSVLSEMQKKQYIGEFSVQCDLTNNSKISISQHVVSIYERIEYLASAYFIYTQIEGGTTASVVTPAANQ